MSWMDDILDHVLGTTDQAPPGAKPDVAIRNPKTFRNLKGTREIRMQRSGEADKGIQAPEGKRDLRGDKKGTLQRKGYYMVQPVHHEESITEGTRGHYKNYYGPETPTGKAVQGLVPLPKMYPYEKDEYSTVEEADQKASMRSGEVDFAAQSAVTRHRELLQIMKGLSGGSNQP